MGWKERLKIEAEELEDRLDKLVAFIGGAVYELLSDVDKFLLLEQHDAMLRYLDILTIRLSPLEDREELSGTLVTKYRYGRRDY